MVGGHLVVVAIVTVTGFLVPRVLGTTSYGTFAAVMAVVAILHAVSPAGLHMVEVRFLAPIWSRGEREQAATLGSSIWTVRLALAAVLGAATAIWLTRASSLELWPATPILAGLICTLRCALSANRSLFLPLGHAGKTIGLEAARTGLILPLVIVCFLVAGLPAVFCAIPVVYAALLMLGIALLRRILPIRLSLASLPALRPHLGFGLSTLIANLATTAHTHLAVWAVATWVVPEEAAYLAVAFHPFTLGSGVYYAARRSLMPQLAELDSSKEGHRLLAWGEVMLRYGCALAALLALVWAVIGRDLVRWALTDAYQPVYPAAALMLVSLALFCWGATCNGLLYVRRRAGWGLMNHVLFACLNLAGVVVGVTGADKGTALRITLAYLGAAAFYAISAHLTLGLRGRVWLPAGRSLLLLAPLALVWPLVNWTAGPGARALALATTAAVWPTLVLGLRLISIDELRRIVHMLRRDPDRGSISPVRGLS